MEGTAVKKWHKRKNTAAEGYEALDRTVWRAGFGRGVGPDVR
jgi:hypothetical protein